MRCKEGEKKKEDKTHPADRGGGGCRSLLCTPVPVSLAKGERM